MVEDSQSMIQREVPDGPEERTEYIKWWHKTLCKAKDDTFKNQFKQMREDMAFVRGIQWQGQKRNSPEDRYMCNITQRYIQQRTASLYAKNPRAIAEIRKRMEFALWDENPQSLMLAQQMPNDPVMQMILQDFHQGTLRKLQFKRIGQTLENLFDYYMHESRPRYKIQIKQLVRRTLTCGVGYVKIGFQRDMAPSPDQLERVRDFTSRLNELEMLAEDLADDEIEPYSKEMEELRITIESVMSAQQMIIREGLMIGFPRSTAIIPDPTGTTQLKGFVGADWIAQEYFFTKDQIKQIYKKDIGTDYTGHTRTGQRDYVTGMGQNAVDKGLARCWELHNLANGTELHLCDGYHDFLRDDLQPQLVFEQGHPYHSLIFNDLEDDENIFPPSDVSLLRHQQMEYNRSRESLREHRIASRPAWISPKGMWDKEDQHKLGNHIAHELLQLNIPVTQNLDISKLLIPKPVAPVDPNVYDVEFLFTDVLRATGNHEATFGGSSGDTATEVSVAEQARVSSIESNIDDMDDLLTDVARDTGQILLLNMSAQEVHKIVGPGAAWPEFSAQEAADEIILTIQAGSSGRPNRAQELANAERIMPYLIQMPGLDPHWLAEQLLKRMDDKMDLNEAFAEGMPSIMAMNAMAKAQQAGMGGGAPVPDNGSGKTNGQGSQPDQQGAQGGNNMENPQQSAPGGQPAYPAGPPNPGNPMSGGQ